MATIFYVYPQFSSWNNINNELKQGRTNNITFSYNFNEARGVPEGWVADVQIDLEIQQPRGILIVDDTVEVYGIGRVNQSNIQNNFGQVRSMTLYLQNSHVVPLSNKDNITEGANVILTKSPNNSSRFEGTSKMCWNLEGSYAIEIVVLMENQTLDGMNTYEKYLGESHVAVTVYPKSDFAQIVTNDVNLQLALIVYGLTVVGTGSLFLSLWDRKASKKNNDDDKNGYNGCTITENVTDKITVESHNEQGTNDEKNKA